MRLIAVVLAPVLVVVLGGAVVLSREKQTTPARKAVPPVVMPAQVVEPAPRPTRVVVFEEGCLGAECHGPMADRPYVHATFAQEACDQCHAPDQGGHVYPQLASTENTCTECHDTGAHHLYQHKAMSEEACLACHDPHASASPAMLAADTVVATCTRCHPRERGGMAHAPYADGQCTECHDQHGADNRMLLRGGLGEDNCRLCHGPIVGAMERGTFSHLEVDGRCLGCHNAHASRREHLLPAPARDLCVTCHDDIEATISRARVSHDSVLLGDQCVTCHDPHTSEHPSMLRATQAQVCMSCHEDAVVGADGKKVAGLGAELKSAALVHGAVRIGDCSACHSVHGGEHASLLRSVNPGVLIGAFDIQNFALCFSCHDRGLVDSPTATLFRDGLTNLHGVHLKADGMSGGCEDCHAVHAGNRPRLIVETLHYQGSDWATPMNFRLAANGGSCAPACHEPMRYSREDGGAP